MSLRDPQSFIETLTHIQKLASSISHQLETIHNIPPPKIPARGPNTTIPSIILTIPNGLFSPIEQLKIPETLRREILASFERNLSQLQQQYRSTYERAYLLNMASGFSTDIEILQNVYQTLYHNHALPMIKSRITFVLEEVAKYQAPTSHEQRRPFNAKYTNFLEKYFEINGYPSVAHRLVLAQKSNMTPRQIEVWFQNHRNRSKKEGKIIRRLNSDFPLKQALNTLQTCISTSPARMPTPPVEDPKAMIPQVEKTSLSQQNSLATKSPSILDNSYPLRPKHAYPATRNSSFPDPFPNRDGVFTFPSPTWRRTPATTSIVPKMVDMDEFAQTFHLTLNFSENSRRRGTTPLIHQASSLEPWFAATTTIAPSAPHPAVIRTRETLQSTPLVPISSLPMFKPTFGSRSFPRPTPLPSSPNKANTRKPRPLPRRTPPHSRASTTGCRFSSFGSDISTSSQTSSSSSDYSSPELSTPPSLPHVDLPTVQDDDQHHQLFDSSQNKPLSDNLISDFFSSDQFDFTSPYYSTKFSDTSFLDGALVDFGHNVGSIFS